MNIEEEDCIQRQASKLASNQEENDLSDRIIQELEEEERDCMADGQTDNNFYIKNNTEQLGISMNQEGIKVPKYGKVKSKRGRKSLKELREVDGKAKEQQKISEMFNIGKGKILPKEG